jgi:competence CoiA-like predicted nuclease
MYAEDKGERKLARPGLKAKCPLCGNEVIAKCGVVKIWHWAHLADQSCDDFKEHESEWHRKWKELFPEENREVIVKKRGNIHFADVKTDDGLVIEFQNSTIPFEAIVERERFYDRMVWVFNCQKGVERMEITDDSIEWWNPRRDFAKCRKKVYLDLGDTLFIVSDISKDLKDNIPIWVISGDFRVRSSFVMENLKVSKERHVYRCNFCKRNFVGVPILNGLGCRIEDPCKGSVDDLAEVTVG